MKVDGSSLTQPQSAAEAQAKSAEWASTDFQRRIKDDGERFKT